MHYESNVSTKSRVAFGITSYHSPFSRFPCEPAHQPLPLMAPVRIHLKRQPPELSTLFPPQNFNQVQEIALYTPPNVVRRREDGRTLIQ